MGIALGALVGAAVGAAMGDKDAALLMGGAVGAGLGGLIGHNIDQRRCELHRLAQQHGVELETAALEITDSQGQKHTIGLQVQTPENTQFFATGNERPTARGTRFYAEMAQRYRMAVPGETPQQTAARLQAMRLLLVGHTDDEGSTQRNADLSEKRARAVAEIFSQNGFSRDQIFFQGAGELFPLANNNSEIGRNKNRRVEVLDLNTDAALDHYLKNRQSNLAYFRPAKTTQAKDFVAPQADKKKINEKRVAPKQQQQPSPKSNPSVIEKISNPKSEKAVVAAQNKAKSSEAVENKGDLLFDFGGQPIQANQASVPNIGQPTLQNGGILSAILPSAHANNAPLGSCLNDQYRASHGVKSLKTGKERSGLDYMRGLYKTSWETTINGHYIALNKVAVLEDGARPAMLPELLLYPNYDGNPKTKASWRSTAQVNTYKGSTALLYRVFIQDGPIHCMDFVIPHQNPFVAPHSILVYGKNASYWQTGFEAKIAK